jgi:hypothetical protein
VQLGKLTRRQTELTLVAPVKKGKKNQAKHVPPELQDMWERDRQKKAEKKDARALERLLAEIDSHASGRGKGKKGKKGKHAASLAHLIPASAAEVADMFDISSDEESGVRPLGHKGRMANVANLLPTRLDQVDEGIRVFLKNKAQNTMSLPPMDKEGRRKVHMLAEAYGLHSKSRGKGTGRFT